MAETPEQLASEEKEDSRARGSDGLFEHLLVRSSPNQAVKGGKLYPDIILT